MTDLLTSLLDGESKYLEFKEKYSKTMLKTLSAFANYHDGLIVLGVTDSGQVIGVDEPNDLWLRIENTINDSVKPHPEYEVMTRLIENKTILIFTVLKGDRTPYTVDRKAYRRTDTSTVEVEKHAYDELVLLGRNLTYEELEYGGEDLSFEVLAKLLRTNLNITDLDQGILKSLCLIQKGSYNNAAALMADRNKFKDIGIDLVCYEDNSMRRIRDRMSLASVSLIEQYQTSLLFYQKHINKGDIIEGPYRKSFEEIPEIAYREAVANAIIHRDYSRLGNNRLEIFEDRVEITSIGGLPVGISEEEYMQGSFSQVRNRIIADILFRCGIIEKMGTGVRRIRNAYAGYNVEPIFQVMDNSIRVVLPKIKAEVFSEKSAPYMASLNPEQEKALNYIRSSQGVNRTELEEYMGVRKTKATKILNVLLNMGVVIKVGGGRDTRYKANPETRM